MSTNRQATRRIKRTADKWWYDERIPTDVQYGSKAYDDRLIDRGHMVRREDPNWGDLAEQAAARCCFRAPGVA